MTDFNLWQKILDSDAVKRNLLPLQFLFGNREEASKFASEDMGKFAEGVMGATKPFRMGANILGQYGGSAITGQDMTQSENQGWFLKWLSEGITQQEQQELVEKPYLAALKSGVGMGSVFMPYASRAIPAASLGTRTAQTAGRGLLEGLAGGFGYSREGKELEDTALGGALGVGGELIGNYAFDPSYRSMVNEGYGNISQGTYQGAVGNLGDRAAGFLNSVKERGVTGDRLLNIQDLADEIMANGGKINRDGTVTLYHATTPEAKAAIESTGRFVSKEPNLFFSTSPNGQIRGYGDSVVEFKIPIEKLELDDIFGTEAHLKMSGKGVGEGTDVSKYIILPEKVSDDIFSPEGIDPGPGYVGSKSEKENSDTFLKILMGNEEDNNLLHNINVKESKRIPGRLAKDRSKDIKDEWRKTYGALLRKWYN